MTLYLYIIAEKFYIILQFNIVRSNHVVNAKQKRLSNRVLTKGKFLPPMESFFAGYLHTVWNHKLSFQQVILRAK